MKFTKIISGLLALGVIILFIKSYQNFKNLEFPSTQLVMFKSLSFYMSVESFENTFVAADKVVEEEEMAYRDTWRAEDPYFYKNSSIRFGRHPVTPSSRICHSSFWFDSAFQLLGCLHRRVTLS